MKITNQPTGWGWIALLIVLGIALTAIQFIFLPYSSFSKVLSEAISLGWAGGLVILVFLLWISLGGLKELHRQSWFVKGLVSFLAYILFCLAIANYHIHFYKETSLLPVSLVLLAVLTFLLAAYFGNARPILRVGTLMLVMTAVIAGFGNWLPQVEGGFPTPEIKLDVYSMTSQQLADEGERIIFGGLGQSNVQGAIGRGQCPLCHTFRPDLVSERAPNLWGITARKRLQPTSIEYIAESHACPSCYVVGGFGVKGTENRESPMPRIHKPPISLSLEELIAVDTWLFVQEGEIPPSPSTIEAAYRRFIPKRDMILTGIREEDTEDEISMPLLVTGKESVDEIFTRTACIACHTIPGIAGATGRVGPLLMANSARKNLQDPNYKGNANSVREYLIESIIDPSRYVVKGFPDHQMPKDFGTKVTALALTKMVEYLAKLEAGKPPPLIN